MKKRTILTILIGFSVATLLFAVYVAENNVPSKVSGGDWISFLGGYFGGIMGAVVSLIVLFFTIDNNNINQEIEFKKQNRCFFDFQELYNLHNKLNGVSRGKNAKLIRTYNYEENIEDIENFGDDSIKLNFIKIVNLGKGSAFNVTIMVKHTCRKSNLTKIIKEFLPFVIQNEELFINIDHKEFRNEEAIMESLVIFYTTLAGEEMKLEYIKGENSTYSTKIYYKEKDDFKELFGYSGESANWFNL